MAEPSEREYRVEDDGAGKFRVLNASDLTVIVCRDRLDAEQHAVLLEESFRRGYQRGFREAKKSR